jgi:predicted dehydrogenase
MKLVTLGTSWITHKFIDAVDMVDGIEYYGSFSRTLKKAEELVRNFEGQKAYDSIDDVINDTDVDVVYIALPNSLHYENAKKCLFSNKHVICEKPITTTVDEFEELKRIADERHLLVFEAIKNLHLPNLNRIREEIRKIEPVRQVRFDYSQYSSKYDKYKEGILLNAFDEKFHGGAITDLGVYPLHALIALFGMPLKSHYTAKIGYGGVDMNGILSLEYEEMIASVSVSKICQSNSENEIIGENGKIVITSGPISNLVEFEIHANGNEEKFSYQSSPNDMIYEVREFVRLLAESDLHIYYQYFEQSRNVLSILQKSRKDIGLKF